MYTLVRSVTMWALFILLVACGSGGGTDSLGSGTARACTKPGVGSAAPRFAYVANSASNNVSAFTICGTGALTPVAGSPFPAGTGGIAAYVFKVHPSGQFAYVANGGSNNVSAYTISPTTGALTAVTGSPFTAGTSPYSVSIEPSGKFAYAANIGSNNVSAYTINATTGALTPVAGSPFAAGTSPYAISIDPSGQFAYAANGGSNDVSAYTIDAQRVRLLRSRVRPSRLAQVLTLP